MANNVKIAIRGQDQSGRAFGSTIRNGERLRNTLRNVATSARGLIGVFGAAAIGRASIQLARADDAASKLSRALGITTEEVSALTFAADRSGVSQRNFETGIRTMIKATADANEGIKTYRDAFKLLKIDAEKFQELTVAEQLEAMADAFGELDENAPKQDLALAIFGARGGLGFLNLMEEGSAGIRQLKDEAKALGAITSTEDGLIAEETVDRMTDLGAAGKGLGRTFNRTLLPAVTSATEALTELLDLLPDMEGKFEAAGKSIGTFFAAVFDEDAAKVVAELAVSKAKADAAAAKALAAAGAGGENGGQPAKAVASAAVKTATEQATVAIEEETEALEKQTEVLDRVRDNTKSLAERVQEAYAGGGDGGPTQQVTIFPPEIDEEIEDKGQKLQSAISSALTGATDEGGQGMLQSFKRTLQRMAVDFATSQILRLLRSFGGGIGGIAGAALQFNDGGVVPGPRGVPRLAMVHGGETILPTHRFGGGGGGGTQVIINEAPGVRSQVRRTQENGIERVVIEQAVGDLIQRDVATGGRISRAIESRYGLRRQ